MRNVDEFFRDSYYNNLRVLLAVCGVWPFQTLGKRCTLYILFIVVFGSSVTFELLCLLEIWPDSFEVVDCLSMLFYAVSSTFKFVYAVYKLPKIKMLLIKIQEHWCSLKSDEETKILRSYTLFARNFGYAYAGTMISHAVLFALTPLVSRFLYLDSDEDDTSSSEVTQDAKEKEGQTHHISYMLDLQMHYIPILVQSGICEVYYTTLLSALNVLYLTCVQHCCGLFAALRYRLESAFEYEDDDGDVTARSAQDKSYPNIVYSIQRHAEAMQFVTAVESLYKLPFFIHVTVNMSLLSIVGFQVITKTESISRILPYASYLSGLVLNTFFENWQGQKIMDCNEKVHESAYKLEWYKMPIMSQKLLIMIMIRSKRPLNITAGKILVLSYMNFSAVMHTAFSYLMLLRSMQ